MKTSFDFNDLIWEEFKAASKKENMGMKESLERLMVDYIRDTTKSDFNGFIKITKSKLYGRTKGYYYYPDESYEEF